MTDTVTPDEADTLMENHRKANPGHVVRAVGDPWGLFTARCEGARHLGRKCDPPFVIHADPRPAVSPTGEARYGRIDERTTT